MRHATSTTVKKTRGAIERSSRKSGQRTRTLGAAFRRSLAKNRAAARSRASAPRAAASPGETEAATGADVQREFPDAVYQDDPRSR